jgi:molecular chaperone DnaJ
MSYYDILGVDSKASSEEIKKAYRKLSMQHHPDKGGDEEQFKKIAEAYSVLSNDEKRQQYDNPDPLSGLGGMGGFPFGFARPRHQKPDLNAPRDGQFIGVEASIPLKHFIFGGQFKINLSYHEGCVDCGGKGFLKGEECTVCRGEGFVQQVERRPGFVSSATRPCHNCDGLGQVPTEKCKVCNGRGGNPVENKEFIFDIPKGVTLGSRIISHGTGRVGINGGRNGDVGIIITNIKSPSIDKLSLEELENFKNLLEVLDNDTESA